MKVLVKAPFMKDGAITKVGETLEVDKEYYDRILKCEEKHNTVLVEKVTTRKKKVEE